MAEPAKAAVPSKVLIIDDEQGLRNMLKYGLAKRGYEVFAVEGGEEALKLARTQSFDLAVCDIMMPGMDGIEVLKALKGISPTTEVIMATGYATLETAVETMKSGAFDYITKPYSLGHLCAIFDKANEHRQLKAKVNYLEELNRLKSEFVSTMSHELRTPLASTMGYISLLNNGIYGAVTERQKVALDRAEINSKHLLELINSVLDFSKLQANRMTLSPETFLLHELVNEAAASVEPLALAKKLAFKTECAEGMAVHCDRIKLKQILVNLTGNAIKFTATGSVTLQVSLTGEGAGVDFRVRDTGVGIAAKDLSLLFEEFRQIDGSHTRKFTGTGLGLAISKRLAELMGGSITVKSELGAGSEFTLHLPIHKTVSLAEPAAPAPAAAPAKAERVILAIDDDPDVLKLLTDSVAGAGFRVISARSGAEGLALARQLQPSCITLDIMMPDMNGWQVLHAIKNDPLLQAIPIYIVSMVEDRAQAFALGVTGYIQKPFSREELLKQISLVTRKAQQVMVVDDDAHIREVLCTALSGEGYEIVPVATGEEALARIKTLCPDILFLDLGLPGISGFDVLLALDEQPNRERVSVFVMTGKDLTQEQQDYLHRRAQMVIQKGAQSFTDLVEMLKKNLTSIQAAA